MTRGRFFWLLLWSVLAACLWWYVVHPQYRLLKSTTSTISMDLESGWWYVKKLIDQLKKGGA